MKNFRELSYLGIKKGLLFRSDSLNKLTDNDIKLLKDNGVKIIVDLRSDEEINEKPDQNIEGIKHLLIPLTMTNEPKKIEIKGLKFLDMFDAYSELVIEDRKESYIKIFDLLMNNECILYHCSEGKDRTGVLTAVILKTLGIDEELIYQDYLLTNKSSLSYKEFAKTLPSDVRDIYIKQFSANKEYLDTAFNKIDELYGNFDNFLLKICNIDINKRNLLKEKYLVR